LHYDYKRGLHEFYDSQGTGELPATEDQSLRPIVRLPGKPSAAFCRRVRDSAAMRISPRNPTHSLFFSWNAGILCSPLGRCTDAGSGERRYE
jgi:hypothetical protein